ncbi:MAG: hypothetical protein LQ340_002898 [Diploschistes diacapsis]|nr:MAG: hypothetical protein LQ340_002898 [Diploschistes diacapsis]
MTRVWEAFARTPEVSEETFVPQPEFFVPRTETRWWEEREANIPSGVVDLPTAALSSERIFPLPQEIRSVLIEKFCQPRNRRKALESESNKDCLVRIYLGSMKGKDGGAFFSLRNFKLHLNHMIDLVMDVLELARYVGGALATLHWQAKVDGRDVEFVLGSSPTNHIYGPLTSDELDRLPVNTYTELKVRSKVDFGRRVLRLWVIDFNQCALMSMDDAGVSAAVGAWSINDPYFPKPTSDTQQEIEVWNIFILRYLEVATRILKNETVAIQKLPRKFLAGIEREHKHKVKVQKAAAAKSSTAAPI